MYVTGNRSLAFLKIQQYFLAYKDAIRTIDLKPEWAKGIRLLTTILRLFSTIFMCPFEQVTFVKLKWKWQHSISIKL
jgi:hypothetical protein